MIGAWSQFGNGQQPGEGELIAFVEHCVDIETLLYGGHYEASFAVFRFGMLHLQRGGVIGLPYGCWWTSLPPFSVRV